MKSYSSKYPSDFIASDTHSGDVSPKNLWVGTISVNITATNKKAIYQSNPSSTTDNTDTIIYDGIITQKRVSFSLDVGDGTPNVVLSDPDYKMIDAGKFSLAEEGMYLVRSKIFDLEIPVPISPPSFVNKQAYFGAVSLLFSNGFTDTGGAPSIKNATRVCDFNLANRYPSIKNSTPEDPIKAWGEAVCPIFIVGKGFSGKIEPAFYRAEEEIKVYAVCRLPGWASDVSTKIISRLESGGGRCRGV